jgi:hypothetical protein
MWRNRNLWILAVIMTLASAVYQRMTGPTYPVAGKARLGGNEISYELLRSHGGAGDQPVTVEVPDTVVGGTLVWRRYKTDDPWTRQEMMLIGGTLTGSLPHQPPAGKLEYHIELIAVGNGLAGNGAGGGAALMIPERENVVTRFKGDVPGVVLLPHILFMFLGMLISTRAGLEALAGGRRISFYAILAAALIFLGGLVFGPMVQKYAFGSYWTGFPVGYDLTDNKTLISMIMWVIALVAVARKSKPRIWVSAASLVTLVIFMIPHSLQGSELDYTGTARREDRLMTVTMEAPRLPGFGPG